VDVVYDGTGATLSGSLDAARVGGTVVYFGSAGGNPPLIDPNRLLNESKRVVGGDLWNHVAEGELQARAAELFGWVRAGRLRARIDSTFPLKRAAEAHARLESRAAIGKVLLTVA
jgi:NADPH2:quinone reductase